MKKLKIHATIFIFILSYLLNSVAVASVEDGCMSKSSSGSKTRTNSTKFTGKCSGCHNVGTPSETQANWVTSNIPASGYVPGTSYNITVTATHANAANDMVGFALSCEDVATNNNKGTFSTPTSDINQPALGCVTHTSAGAIANAQGSRTWTIPWVAPTAGTGSVKFFSSLVTGNRGASTDFGWLATLTVSEAVVVSCPTALAVTSTNTTCGVSNGTVSIGAVTGGVSPYTYSFNGGAYSATTSYSNLVAGTYSVSVKDANACVFTTSVTVTNTPGPTALVVTPVNTTCGQSNGTVTFGTVTGGTMPFTYSFNGGTYSTTTTYSNLASNIYPVSVKDANGCTFSTSVTVANSGGPTAIASTITNSTCGLNNGSVSLGVVTGGAAPYTFDFNNTGYTSTTTYSNLVAGIYSVTVKDVSGCTFSTTITVTNVEGPNGMSIQTQMAICGNPTGIIMVSGVSGGTTPYTYSFNGSPYSTQSILSGIPAGYYPVSVQDANGCTYASSATVVTTPPIVSVVLSSTNSTNGAADGTVTIGAVSGGSAPYTYDFNYIGTYSSTTIYTGLLAGIYSVTVKDSYGCTFSTSVTVGNTVIATVPVIATYSSTSITTTTASCSGSAQSDGGAALTAKGICWGLNLNPDLTGSFTNEGTAIGTFISNLTGLTPATLYHFRAYATNSVGTAYGEDLTFTTLQQSLGYTLSGNIVYHNTANSAIANATVSLMEGTTAIATTQTNANGTFSFANIANGTYTLQASSSLPWGGVTAIDVLKMKRHISSLELFTEPLVLNAADVNLSNSINATDALKVQRRIASLDLSFPCPDWIFAIPTIGGTSVTVNNADVSQNLHALCAADVNGSNLFAVVKNNISVSLENKETIHANANELVTIPVSISKNSEIGAFQLFLNYPANAMEFMEVSMKAHESELVYRAENGKLALVWSSLNSLQLNENEAIVYLTFKTAADFEGTAALEIENNSEIADALGNAINENGLNSVIIEISSTTTINNVNLNSINVFPNPSKNNVFVNMGNYSTKDASVSIYNPLGKLISVDHKAELNNQIKFDFSGFANGLYLIQINTPDGKIVKSVSVNK